MTDRSASASVKVTVDPMSAFTAFTDEIDSWWVRGPINFFDSGRAVAMRIEPGVGGRVLEIYDDARGEALELGQITVWEPGVQLAYRSLVDDTEVDVRFEAVEDGTQGPGYPDANSWRREGFLLLAERSGLAGPLGRRAGGIASCPRRDRAPEHRALLRGSVRRGALARARVPARLLVRCSHRG